MSTSISLTFKSVLQGLKNINSSFDSGVLRVAYTGLNRNGSFISKDTFERCADTIFNCPIVCNYDRETDSIGGHDVEVYTDTDGNVRMANITTPVGCIPESSQWFWDVVQEDDGTEHEYFCVEVLLWRRQEAYEKIVKDGCVSHSMEINVDDGAMRDGVYVINKFTFTALCLLGDDVQPCFESSSLHLFDKHACSSKFAEMVDELKNSMADIQAAFNHTSSITEGGKSVLNEEIKAMMAEFNLTEDAIDFDVNGMSLEELRAKFTEMTKKTEDPKFSLTGEQFMRELLKSLCAERLQTEWGEIRRYWYVDHSVDNTEVYFFDMEDDNLYGTTYSMNGDNVVIDFACKKRKKCQYVDFDNGEQSFSMKENIAGIVSNVRSEIESKFTEEKASLNSKIAELQKFHDERVCADRKNAEEAVFSQFEDLCGNEQFEKLRENCADLEIESIEEKCYAIRGRSAKAAFSVQSKPPKIAVEKKQDNDVPYGGIFEKYLKK